MPLFSTFKTTGLAAASLVAAAALFAPAAAAQQPQQQPAQPDQTVGQPVTGSNIIVIGAIKDPSDRSAPVAEDRTVPELPVVYEETKAPAHATGSAAGAPPASAARR